MPLSLLSISIAISMAVSTLGASETVHGLARAKDGDSLMVGQTEVRLFGVDAPELGQTCKKSRTVWACGAEAADRLSMLVAGKDVSCTSMGTDQYNRTLGRCTVGAIDINRIVVATGFAVAYRRYSIDYISAEETARVNRRGIWAGTFEMPSDFRHGEPPAAHTQAWRHPREPSFQVTRLKAPVASGGCSIKGNQGTNGWIYHVPGMPYYAQTRAEHVFCSEAEARAAGYRRAKVR